MEKKMEAPVGDKGQNRKKIILFAAIAVIVLAIAITIFFMKQPVVAQSLTLEAGEPLPPPSAFILNPKKAGRYEINESEIDSSKPGLYPVKITAGGRQYISELIVQDTTVPTAVAVDVVAWEGQAVKEEDFVRDVRDGTTVTMTFESRPDTSVCGESTVAVVLSDEAGNTSRVTSQMRVYQVAEQLNVSLGYDKNAIKPSDFMMDVAEKDKHVFTLETDIDTINFAVPGRHVVVLKIGEEKTGSVLSLMRLMPRGAAPVAIKRGTADHEPPVITGNLNKKVFIGDTVSYRSGVIAADNRDGEVALQVNSGAVNPKAEGEYPIIYSAVDASGNRATASGKITVYKVSNENVGKMADEVLEKIINNGMSQYDKAQAIFNWMRSHITYMNSSVKDNVTYAAYRGLRDGRGDCYVYYALAELLLKRAGIQNIPVRRIPEAKTAHYWSLVNVGSGWYHFDTSPHVNGGSGFMLTESQAQAYTAQRGKNYYDYDKSLYPEVVR